MLRQVYGIDNGDLEDEYFVLLNFDHLLTSMSIDCLLNKALYNNQYDVISQILTQNSTHWSLKNSTCWSISKSITENNLINIVLSKDPIELIRFLIHRGYDINFRTMSGTKTNLIYWACHYGFVDVVKYLIQEGADVNFKDILYGSSLLSQSIIDNHREVFDLLLKHDVNVNAQDRGMVRPVYIAACTNEYYLEQLIEHGAELNYSNFRRCSPMRGAAINNKHLNIELLIKHGHPVDFKLTSSKNQPLIDAYMNKSVDAAKVLIKHGAHTKLFMKLCEDEQTCDLFLPAVQAVQDIKNTLNKQLTKMTEEYGIATYITDLLYGTCKCSLK